MTLAGLSTLAYGVWAEPLHMLRVQRWTVPVRGWTGAPMTLAVLADIHMANPWMPLERLAAIVARTNALAPDLVVFAGDLHAHHRFVRSRVGSADAAALLARLDAPLGRLAILGNHDWWFDEAAQARQAGPTEVGLALDRAGVPVLHNRAVRIDDGARAFWIAGLADQLAIGVGPGTFRGLDDLPGTLAQVTDDAPVILLAHEPDIFPAVPDRVALTISGHTHGGQVRLFGWSPVVPSKYGNRYAYGMVREGVRHLIVSGGLGCSIAPFRLGVPPEITLIRLTAAAV